MDVLLMEAVRSPLCLPVTGGLQAMTPIELVRQTVDGLLQRTGIETIDVDRILIECGTEAARQVEASDWLTWPSDEPPTDIPSIVIGRWCGTGQQALHMAARGIKRGLHDVVVVVGVESIHHDRATPQNSETCSPTDPLAASGRDHILAAEVLAAKWTLDREQLDTYTVRSHQRASEVASSGEFDSEIVAINVATDGPRREVTRDEAIDSTLTVDQLRALRPTLLDPVIARPDPDISWSITAGNSSQRVMGTSAVLLVSKSRAAQFGLRARARLRGLAVAAPDPALPLAAPLHATERILAATKTSLAQVDHVEVGEEFAAVPLAWTAEFPISANLFNPRGGSLALGNARACAGLRQITTMLAALEATGGRLGLQTMSADTGSAYAVIVERS